MDMSVSRMSFFCPLSPTKTDFSRKDTTWMKRLPPCRRTGRTGRTGRTYIGFDVLCIWYRQIWTVRESNSVATDAQLYPKIRGDVCLIGTSSQEYYNINMHETIFYSFGHFIYYIRGGTSQLITISQLFREMEDIILYQGCLKRPYVYHIVSYDQSHREMNLVILILKILLSCCVEKIWEPQH